MTWESRIVSKVAPLMMNVVISSNDGKCSWSPQLSNGVQHYVKLLDRFGNTACGKTHTVRWADISAHSTKAVNPFLPIYIHKYIHRWPSDRLPWYNNIPYNRWWPRSINQWILDLIPRLKHKNSIKNKIFSYIQKVYCSNYICWLFCKTNWGSTCDFPIFN